MAGKAHLAPALKVERSWRTAGVPWRRLHGRFERRTDAVFEFSDAILVVAVAYAFERLCEKGSS